MCVVCGCSEHQPERVPQSQAPVEPAVPGHWERPPSGGMPQSGAGGTIHPRVLVPGMSQERAIRLETDILGANNRVAQQNRAHFESHGVTALNLVSSPGSGKTTLLCATIAALKKRAPDLHVAVIEGDQQTSFDADRIRATGAPAIQVNTGKGCHLDAPVVAEAFAQLHAHDHHAHDHAHDHDHGDQHHHHGQEARSLLFIENVGNLVCPAAWDLGEAAKVAILSVTEGEDKPLKYPDMFAASQLMILNKTDLLPHVKFDVARCIALARRVNPGIEILQLSATTGEGMDAWLHWLDHAMGAHHPHHDEPASEEAVLRERVRQLEVELAKARAALPTGSAA
jgi:hydrogenase nickel incorporation protein HypB